MDDNQYLNVKTIEDCIEIATMDTYDEYEAIEGWLTCLEDIFENIKQVEIFDKIAKFIGFEIEKNTNLLVKIESDNKIAKVSIDSIKFINQSSIQKLWIKAWLDYSS